MVGKVTLVLLLALTCPPSVAAQSWGELLRGAGEGALLGAGAGAVGWATYCGVEQPDDDVDPPLCALWGGIFHAPSGMVAGLGLAAEDAGTLRGRVRIVGLATAAGLAMGTVAALAAGNDFGSALPAYGGVALGSGLVVATMGPWLHRTLGRPVAFAALPRGWAVRVGGF